MLKIWKKFLVSLPPFVFLYLMPFSFTKIIFTFLKKSNIHIYIALDFVTIPGVFIFVLYLQKKKKIG